MVVDAHANFGVFGRQVEAGNDDGLALGSPVHAAAGQHAGRREHDALYRSTRRCRMGGVDVLDVEKGHASEQAALGAAASVCVVVGTAAALAARARRGLAK